MTYHVREVECIKYVYDDEECIGLADDAHIEMMRVINNDAFDEIYTYLRNLSEIISDKATGRHDNFLMSCTPGLDNNEMLNKAKEIAITSATIMSLLSLEPKDDSVLWLDRVTRNINKEPRFR